MIRLDPTRAMAARSGAMIMSLLIAGGTTTPVLAQVRAVQIVPAQPSSAAVGASAGTVQPAATVPIAPPTAEPVGAPAEGAAPAPADMGFTPAEIARLRTTYTSLTPAEQEEMVATFKDMGVDLAALLGLKPAAAAATIVMPLPDAVRALNFARKPEAVLSARSQLGFSASVMPDRSNTQELAKWLHLNLMAGEWSTLGQFLPLLTPDDATAVYSHILRSTNDGPPGLLPEEVLAIGDACPGEMADWMLDVLSNMLKNSASRYGTGQFLTRIKEGTRMFGTQDDARRLRTVRLLVGAELALEAYEYLPPLDEARAKGDARVIYAHGRYHQDLVESGRMGDAEATHQDQAWACLAEVALMPGADVALRKDAMSRNIDMLANMPPALGTQWLSEVFANESMGPAALEVVALQAMTFRDKKVDAAKRAQGIATMKAAVDTLLRQEDVNLQTLRVPLRMLTTALADEVDAAVKEKGDIRGVARETELLFRACPDERWLGAIEPSVAIRGYRSSIAIATTADETDVALDVLANAAKRFPDQAVDLADVFLQQWERRLNPKGRQDDFDNPFIFYAQQRVPSAPLTRGRQRRNLDRLERLIALLEPMGIKARQLPSVTSAFKACHARTEVFDRNSIATVFGPIDQLSPSAAAALAESMRTGLGGDWRNRQVQRSFGMMRSQAEISDIVEEGYELAIELAGRAVAQEPESWRHAVLKAALSYDRVQFKQTQQKADFATYNEYRRQAFSAFEQASAQYADLVAKGLERDSSGVYLRWFSAVLDIGQATPTGKDEVKAEETTADDQISRIAKAMKALPPDAYERHVGAFARDLVESLSGAPPERKPALVRASCRIVGDHPAGAPLRRLNELYEDLLKNEIRLRITVDGSDRVASGKLFGAVLTLRYTNSVDRETGGFDKYLYQDAYVRIGNQYRSINYQAQVKKGIESALGDSFEIESIGFFEPMTPSRAVKEDGQSGWQEKPMAYILLKAKDPSVDRMPQISFDMHFDDQSGAVTLPIISNSPPIDASGDQANRPIKNLKVIQTVDTRRLVAGTEDKAVTIEVQAAGEGVIPDVNDLLDGVKAALPGYEVAADGIEARPYSIMQADTSRNRMFFYGPPQEDKTVYATADEDGIFRLPTERSWLITMKPGNGSVGKTLTLPKLKEGVAGTLASKQYSDMDIVEVQGPTIAVVPRLSMGSKLGIIIALAAALVVGVWLRFRKRPTEVQAAGGLALPTRITPLSTIVTLQRLAQQEGGLTAEQREALRKDIADIQRASFGPGNGVQTTANTDQSALKATLDRWVAAAAR